MTVEEPENKILVKNNSSRFFAYYRGTLKSNWRKLTNVSFTYHSSNSDLWVNRHNERVN